MPGSSTLHADVTNISRHGFWLFVDDREFLLPFEIFPWFKDAPVQQILNVERPRDGHLYWPDLDVDLTIDAIQHPERYPMQARVVKQSSPPDQEIIMRLLAEAKAIGRKYYATTGKPLGITGEVAEYEAARILGLKLSPARQAGYDAIETKDGAVRLLQIKGRCLQDSSKPGQRVGRIRTDQEWDAVLLVLLDTHFDATAIYEADRPDIVAALTQPGSIARNERGALSVSKFRSIGKLRWKRAA
jgi:hypothetical protein